MRLRKPFRRLGSVVLMGGLALAILMVSASLAAARGSPVFVGAPVFFHFHHPLFARRPFVRTPFGPFVVQPFFVNHVMAVSARAFSSRPVVFVSPARFVLHRKRVRTPRAPVVRAAAAVDRISLASSATAVSAASVVPTPAFIDRKGNFMPAMGGVPRSGRQ